MPLRLRERSLSKLFSLNGNFRENPSIEGEEFVKTFFGWETPFSTTTSGDTRKGIFKGNPEERPPHSFLVGFMEGLKVKDFSIPRLGPINLLTFHLPMVSIVDVIRTRRDNSGGSALQPNRTSTRTKVRRGVSLTNGMTVPHQQKVSMEGSSGQETVPGWNGSDRSSVRSGRGLSHIGTEPLKAGKSVKLKAVRMDRARV